MLTAYLYLVLSSIFLCAMSLLRKQYQRISESYFSVLVFVFLSNAAMAVIGNIAAAFQGFAFYGQTDGAVLGIAAAYAAVSFASTFISVKGTKYGNVSVLIMFANLGQLVISSVYGLIFDAQNNSFGAMTVFGYVTAAAIMVLSLFAKKKGEDASEKKNGKIFFLLCAVLFLFNGAALPLCSLMTRLRPQYGSSNFLTLSSMFGTAIGAIATLAALPSKKASGLVRRGIVARGGLIVLYAGACFVSNLLAVLCTTLLPIVVQAPLSFSISMIVLMLFDFLIYKEKPTKINALQIALAVACNVFFAL